MSNPASWTMISHFVGRRDQQVQSLPRRAGPFGNIARRMVIVLARKPATMCARSYRRFAIPVTMAARARKTGCTPVANKARRSCLRAGTMPDASQDKDQSLHRRRVIMHLSSAEWLPVSTAPSDRELEVCVLDYDGIVHALVFPCHREGAEWIDDANRKHLGIQPTHWRNWMHSAN
ncbi:MULTISPECIES: hypothetical protein [unclassified Bradyrhizobium]|uniref:hypothetical protein n=1 Tax=unclassified Bradyrhizobium TaxID=2631580 RepID=UPI00247A657E|nr:MULTISPECIES: hypothetical protein [unclassified Bradyrhizobium]WGS19523.1 hypothetical protein MTX22_34965 [Bradyrhizobium sp. ISRA463]WGS26361.1 hypothetical protein MTX19_32445 [Bradyrhizobium sp. ISRA464]